MTRHEANQLASQIIGPPGNIKSPIRLMESITESLLCLERQTVDKCSRLARSSGKAEPESDYWAGVRHGHDSAVRAIEKAFPEEQ